MFCYRSWKVFSKVGWGLQEEKVLSMLRPLQFALERWIPLICCSISGEVIEIKLFTDGHWFPCCLDHWKCSEHSELKARAMGGGL